MTPPSDSAPAKNAVSRDDWITSLVCFALGFAVMFDTRTYPQVQGQGFGHGPGFYPQVLAGLLLLFGGLNLLKRLRARGGAAAAQAETRVQPRQRLVGAVLAVCVGLMLAMQVLGFLFSGFLLTLLTIRLIRGGLGGGHWLPDLLFAAGIIALVFLLFEVFIGIQLPVAHLPG
jgi:hypothetical protein